MRFEELLVSAHDRLELFLETLESETDALRFDGFSPRCNSRIQL